MSRKKMPEIIILASGKLDEIKTQVAVSAILEEDKKIILLILSTYAWLYHQLQMKKLGIQRLRSLFGFSTEKRPSGLKQKNDKNDPPDINGLSIATAQGDTLTGSNLTVIKKIQNRDPAKNHGRLGADDYTGCPEVVLAHPTLTVGSLCPNCAACNTKGTLRNDTDALQTIVRLIGSPIITGTRYLAPGMRCGTCQTRFQTPIPDEIKNTPKYDVSCATSLAIARYSLGLPMYRMEQNQNYHGIPMKDATQWDLLKKLFVISLPIYIELKKQASNGSLMLYDDTPGRILVNKSQGLTTHTTAFISIYDEHKIHLYFTGQKHAGNNADSILANRTTEEPVIAMMDASPSNIPKNMDAELTSRFILCFCLTHGRRKFFEIYNFFDQECDFVLDIIGQVYANDKHCKDEKFSPEERLLYHQTNSQTLMEALRLWLNNQLTYELNEPNSGLGAAVRYMLRHWIPLTTFLRVAGAPLDNSWAERTIKIAIRHRRNSLFYKTPKGAEVGDCLMSIIYTCTQNSVNPYDYLNTLQRHGPTIKINPECWLPWNHLDTMANLSSALAA